MHGLDFQSVSYTVITSQILSQVTCFREENEIPEQLRKLRRCYTTARPQEPDVPTIPGLQDVFFLRWKN